MLNENQLEELSYEIDDVLVKFSHKYKIGTLSLCAVTLARLLRATEVNNERKDFEMIMMTALQSHSEQPTIQ